MWLLNVICLRRQRLYHWREFSIRSVCSQEAFGKLVFVGCSSSSSLSCLYSCQWFVVQNNFGKSNFDTLRRWSSVCNCSSSNRIQDSVSFAKSYLSCYSRCVAFKKSGSTLNFNLSASLTKLKSQPTHKVTILFLLLSRVKNSYRTYRQV